MNKGKARLLMLEWRDELFKVLDRAEEVAKRVDDSYSNLAYGRLSPERKEHYARQASDALTLHTENSDAIEAMIREMIEAIGEASDT